MNTNYKSLVALHIESGFYAAYEESHGITLQPEDMENDYIENLFDQEGGFGESDCAGL